MLDKNDSTSTVLYSQPKDKMKLQQVKILSTLKPHDYSQTKTGQLMKVDNKSDSHDLINRGDIEFEDMFSNTVDFSQLELKSETDLLLQSNVPNSFSRTCSWMNWEKNEESFKTNNLIALKLLIQKTKDFSLG